MYRDLIFGLEKVKGEPALEECYRTLLKVFNFNAYDVVFNPILDKPLIRREVVELRSKIMECTARRTLGLYEKNISEFVAPTLSDIKDDKRPDQPKGRVRTEGLYNQLTREYWQAHNRYELQLSLFTLNTTEFNAEFFKNTILKHDILAFYGPKGGELEDLQAMQQKVHGDELERKEQSRQKALKKEQKEKEVKDKLEHQKRNEDIQMEPVNREIQNQDKRRQDSIINRLESK